jgi:succinate-acetate transporter protein
VTACQSKTLLGTVFLIAAARFALGGLHQLTANELWEDAGGVVGLALFLLAIYSAFAGEIEDAQGRTVLPIGRRKKGRLAVDGSLWEQLKNVPNEPGVRQQL